VLFTGLRFGWGPLENGLALAFLGVTTALMQGAGIRPLLARFGERRAIALGLSASIAAYTLYALVPLGWMLFPVMAIGSLGGLTGPALQGRISRAVTEDEQGGVQGALASLGSLAAIVSPIVATALFALFTAPHAPWTLPGAPFLLGALLLATGLALAQRTTRGELEGSPVAAATTGATTGD
jgi:DHA1 family tetracycline resistance protein-like MFS transporter